MADIRPTGAVVPGQQGHGVDPRVVAMLMTKPRVGEATPLVGALKTGTEEAGKPIGQEQISKAQDTLQQYKASKSALEDRIIDDELWYEMRHWSAIKGRKGRTFDPSELPEPSSAWLFNAILNKHADAMDNYPEPLVLPRELSDEQTAKTLSSVLPCVMEGNEFEKVYSDNWWEKLKHGTACYGVFFDPNKENGLGDVDIRMIDLLKIFWEPGISDIQESRNLFIVDLVDTDILREQFPEFGDKLGAGAQDIVKQYVYDDNVDTREKSLVVDWYYKLKSPDGRTLVHLVKYCGNCVLYASENDPDYAADGYYAHGMYPVVFDVMFPEKCTPTGFGYVSICKDPQMYIDKLSANIQENAMMTTKKRFFVSDSTNINEKEFQDWTKPFVHVAGQLTDLNLQEIVTQPMSAVYLSVMQQKIEEMKDTAANRDVNSGGAGSGVTAAAAIAALQEAGNKASRDMISASYRAYTQIVKLVIEIMRQFYDEARPFRITMPNGAYEFISMSNAGLMEQQMGTDGSGEIFVRKPVFDLKIKAQKKNPFSRMEQNETAKELYGMGFFQPENAQQALTCLDMMEFEGADKMREEIQRGQTLYNVVQQLMAENNQLKLAMGMMPAQGVPMGGAPAPQGAPSGGQSINDAVMQAQTPMTGYGQRLAERSKPDMNRG